MSTEFEEAMPYLAVIKAASEEERKDDPGMKINADLIRRMNIDQLTQFMVSFDDKPCPPISKDNCERVSCVVCWFRWLSLPVIDDTFNDNMAWYELESGCNCCDCCDYEEDDYCDDW